MIVELPEHEEEEVHLTVRGVGCEGRLDVRRDRADQGRVHELSLGFAAPPPEANPRLHASSHVT